MCAFAFDGSSSWADKVQDTTAVIPSSTRRSTTESANLLWSRIAYQFDRVSESLDLLQVDTPSPRNPPHFVWPDGKSVSEPYECELEGKQLLAFSPDGLNAYLTSSESALLIAFKCDRTVNELREYSRVQLGFTKAGASAVASGGVWVFVACEPENRVLVLRLCHDWYQDRTRLLLMRVVHEAGGPNALAASRDGRHVAVAFRNERFVRIYHCRMNGRLELCAQHYLSRDIKELRFSEKPQALIVCDGVGSQMISLESIF